MKVLVLGVGGMLGHKVYQVFAESGIEVYGTMRKSLPEYISYSIFKEKNVIDNIDVRVSDNVQECLLRIKPDCVINCVGVIKSLVKDPSETIAINSLFPHRIAKISTLINCRLIHISTDCVFSGKQGDYTEDSIPDATDLYGRSKLLGEVTGEPHLTIRTSIIGRELKTKHNLLEWILNSEGTIKGYVNAVFTGVTTKTLAKLLLRLLFEFNLTGLIHIGGEKINKYELACLVKKVFRLNDLTVEKFNEFYCDRSLRTERFKQTGIHVPSMEEMLSELCEENSIYEPQVLYEAR
ncbi:MAG: SDR family oxidoreductase [Candidatus Edwardsbacteria bacterium]